MRERRPERKDAVGPEVSEEVLGIYLRTFCDVS